MNLFWSLIEFGQSRKIRIFLNWTVLILLNLLVKRCFTVSNVHFCSFFCNLRKILRKFLQLIFKFCCSKFFEQTCATSDTTIEIYCTFSQSQSQISSWLPPPSTIINFQSMFDSTDLSPSSSSSVHSFFSNQFTANSVYNNDIGCDIFSPSERTFVFSAVKKTIKNSFFTRATYSLFFFSK